MRADSRKDPRDDAGHPACDKNDKHDKNDKNDRPNENGDEVRRAAVYGWSTKELLDKSLVIPPGRHVLLEAEEGGKRPGHARLEPKHIDDVKRWIGVPDELGAKRSCCNPRPAGVPAVASAGDYRNLDPQMRLALRALADEYVHGDSRRVEAYAPVLAHILDRSYLNAICLRQDIDIHKGAVLQVGKSIKILFARHIRIWRGGLLKLDGATKIDAVSITGDVAYTVAIPLDEVLPIGRYVTAGEAHG